MIFGCGGYIGFGVGGKVITDVSGIEKAFALAAQSDGKLGVGCIQRDGASVRSGRSAGHMPSASSV
jgi:hypothetical protein